MDKLLDSNKIATLTGRAVQDDETFKEEGGFVAERDQFYFEMMQGDNTFYVGLKDMLISIKMLESIAEIPEINAKWWSQMESLYGEEIMPPRAEYDGELCED